ncbi:MAG: RNA-binding protein [Clostridiales bacterium]|jgi:RNA-binding protein YlmH|nr:RNA-binding protein [Clostridiales bacterium]
MDNMVKEDQLLKRRFLDLANMAERREALLFTDFLNLHEQNLFLRMINELPRIKYFSYGGFEEAERKILCFCGNDTINEVSEIVFPIAYLHITPINSRFSDKLTHRDILGAILNLGIDRGKIGDIIIDNNESYLICSTSISDFIINELSRIKHTTVSASIIDKQDFEYKPNLKTITGTVTSIRLDSILSIAFRGSRSSLSKLIAGGKVFVNSKCILSNSHILKENDIVSVRGYGKFIYSGITNQTKKGRYLVKIFLYQ